MDREYVIFNIRDGKHSEAVLGLQASPSVKCVDMLEGDLDVIMLIKDSNRKRLAQNLVQALAAVETITEDLHVPPAGNEPGVKTGIMPPGKVIID